MRTNERSFLAGGAIALLLFVAVVTPAQTRTAQSKSIVFPAAASSFRPGTNVEIAQRYCLSCHSSDYVSTQPVLSKAVWMAEVVKMRGVYGAPIPEDQVALLVDYLTAQYGPAPSPAP